MKRRYARSNCTSQSGRRGSSMTRIAWKAKMYVLLPQAQRCTASRDPSTWLRADSLPKPRTRCHRRTNTIRVPRPIAHGIAGSQSYLVLEHLELVRGDASL